MSLIRRMRVGLAALRSERGFAVPTVLTVMVVGMGFSAVAVSIAVTSQGETFHDFNRKSALAIADAGAQRALYTYNKITTNPATNTPCVVKSGVGSAASLTAGGYGSGRNGFCTAVGGAADPDAHVGNGYWTYWVNPQVTNAPGGPSCSGSAGTREIKIVSEGFQDNVTRRVAITACGIPGLAATGNAKAIGLDGFSMSGWSELEVPGATNQDFVMKKEGGCPGTGADRDGVADDDPLNNVNGCPRVCPGDWKYPVEVSVAPGHDLVEAPGTQRCTPGRVNPPGPPESNAVVVDRSVSLPPVDIGSAKTVNDDARLGSCTTVWTNRSTPSAAPRYSVQPGCTLTGGSKDSTNGPGTVTWDAATRTLTMNGDGDVGHRLQLNLTGTNYYFCKIDLKGWSNLQIANPSPIPNTNNVGEKWNFDSPENCPGNPTTQISVADGSNISSSTWQPFAADNDPTASIGLLPLVAMSGSSKQATKAEFTTGSWFYANKMMLYAPRTNIVLNTWARENEGWFAGKTIAMQAGAEIESPPTLDPIGIGIVPADYILFRQHRYVECGAKPSPTSPADANC